jgi:hypothetical protein
MGEIDAINGAVQSTPPATVTPASLSPPHTYQKAPGRASSHRTPHRPTFLLSRIEAHPHCGHSVAVTARRHSAASPPPFLWSAAHRVTRPTLPILRPMAGALEDRSGPVDQVYGDFLYKNNSRNSLFQ